MDAIYKECLWLPSSEDMVLFIYIFLPNFLQLDYEVVLHRNRTKQLENDDNEYLWIILKFPTEEAYNSFIDQMASRITLSNWGSSDIFQFEAGYNPLLPNRPFPQVDPAEIKIWNDIFTRNYQRQIEQGEQLIETKAIYRECLWIMNKDQIDYVTDTLFANSLKLDYEAVLHRHHYKRIGNTGDWTMWIIVKAPSERAFSEFYEKVAMPIGIRYWEHSFPSVFEEGKNPYSWFEGELPSWGAKMFRMMWDIAYMNERLKTEQEQPKSFWKRVVEKLRSINPLK